MLAIFAISSSTVIFFVPGGGISASKCDCLGHRHKHRFKCLNCGSYQHSDRNSAINLLKLGESVVSSMALVDVPMVAEALSLATSFCL